MRVARVFVICLLLVLLPLRGVLAAQQMDCGHATPPASTGHDASHDGAHHGDHHNADSHEHSANPCKLCAPCCLLAAPPPVALLSPVPSAPAMRAPQSPAERWASIVPALPDPPPRA
jgi:hypothetical protein